jgi:armadillo repeat-containing protein 3
LDSSDIITEGFYDFGFVGCNLSKVDGFPTLKFLNEQPVISKREILLVDGTLDTLISRLTTFLAEVIPGHSKETQIKLIAVAVSKAMGGPISKSEITSFSYKSKIFDLKLKTNSNVLTLGQISQGTFYHRTLLFKVLCDRLKFRPCILVRGEYNRAWNIIDVKNVVVDSTPVVKVKPTSKSKGSGSLAIAAVSTLADQKILYFGSADTILAESYDGEQPCIIDLIFEPGKLIPIDSKEALDYQRQYAE